VTQDIVIVENLEKTYSDGTRAVNRVSFRVREGEFYGILGPNGAGKSTIIGIVGTLVRPSKGKVLVDGLDVTKDFMRLRNVIGYATQDAGLDEVATGREFLMLQARLYGQSKTRAKERSEELIKLFDLQEAANRQIKSYSGGTKRRIDLAAALIHRPKLLFLDEPTEGLDPYARQVIWKFLKHLNKQMRTTVLLTTHYMDEADHLCDRIAIVDRGKIVVEDTPTHLKLSVEGQGLLLDYGDNMTDEHLKKAEDIFLASNLSVRTVRSGSQLIAYLTDAAGEASNILKSLAQAKLSPKNLRIQQPTLEDVYLKYTGRTLEELKETSN
jgi:ABC-2 type transport system ATP-binding protein